MSHPLPQRPVTTDHKEDGLVKNLRRTTLTLSRRPEGVDLHKSRRPSSSAIGLGQLDELSTTGALAPWRPAAPEATSPRGLIREKKKGPPTRRPRKTLQDQDRAVGSLSRSKPRSPAAHSEGLARERPWERLGGSRCRARLAPFRPSRKRPHDMQTGPFT